MFGLWLLSAGAASLAAFGHRALRGRFGPRGRALRLYEEAPPYKIADVPAGQLVRVTGRLRAEGEPLVAPLSGRSCSHWRATVELCGKDSRAVVVTRESSGTFCLEDDTGRVALALGREPAVIDVTMDMSWLASEVDAETLFDLERFLYGSGARGQALVGRRDDVRYAEGVLEAGELVTAVGIAAHATLSPESTRETPYRARRPPLSLVAPPGLSMFVSDGVHFT